MLEKLFPYRLYLTVLQLEGYELVRFISWVTNNFFKRSLEQKKGLEWTPKAKLIIAFSIFYSLIALFGLKLIFGWVGLAIGFGLLTQSYVFLLLGAVSVKPYDLYARRKIVQRTRNKIQSFSGLKVIGITGSFGKSSTKEFLYQILKTKYSVLRTPGSYNTLLGIAKCVDYELDRSYEFFICEMGAYKIGEIAEICKMVGPKYGILTGINEQHLERFGSLENTTKGKFELVEAVGDIGFALVNGDNERAFKKSQQFKNCRIYGLSQGQYTLENLNIVGEGSSFTFNFGGKRFEVKTNIIAESILSNILVASAMAYELGVKPEKIASAVSLLKPLPHRLEIKNFENGTTLIDDAYSSNVDGFKEALSLLGRFSGRPRVLVTPGIVELGEKTLEIHKKLGEFCVGKCDMVLLVGKSNRTLGLERGIDGKVKIEYLNSIKELWGKLRDLSLDNPVVLLENDLPDNY